MPKTTSTPGLTLTLRRTFTAPRERVFRAWTDPAELKQWFAPGELTTPTAVVDLRVGGRYRIAMAEPGGEPFYLNGVYKEVRAPERLVYTFRWEDPGELDPGETLVTVEFHERGGKTEVVITHEQLANAEDRRKHEEGWTGCLEKLTAVLA